MKKQVFILICSLISLSALADGVITYDSISGKYLTLVSSKVSVSIKDQIALTKTVQVFKNPTHDSVSLHYAFPLPETASATNIFYKVYGKTYTATFAAKPQDSTFYGTPTGNDEVLTQYLGNTPVHYPIKRKLAGDSLITVELTYVELLPYNFGKVKYVYKNDYSSIQDSIPLVSSNFEIKLESGRTIDSVFFYNYNSGYNITNTGKIANLVFKATNFVPDKDFSFEYVLNQNEFGLFGYSTYVDKRNVPDGRDRGFFAFIVEPDPSANTEVINKAFTLIIDKSGSMSGTKIEQAKDAARFIVKHMNNGDYFNIIAFSDYISSFKSSHVIFNPFSETEALNFIDGLYDIGSTDISLAFQTAVPQFSSIPDNTANSIIFLTDGEQTAGILDTDDLIKYINDLVVNSKKDINIFTFGIGSSTNQKLLSAIAQQNGGLVAFLKDQELESVVTDFYLKIRNPVLLHTSLAFDPAIVNDIYPIQLPNLYKGQQMLVVGRYKIPGLVDITLSGSAFGNKVSYKYQMELADSNYTEMSFLQKLWAKSKIDELMIQYYQQPYGSPDADTLKAQIIKVSVEFGVLSPFTSFSGDSDPTGSHTSEVSSIRPDSKDFIGRAKFFGLVKISPNPFTNFIKYDLFFDANFNDNLYVKIYNDLGILIFSKTISPVFSQSFEDIIQIPYSLTPGVYTISFQYKNEYITQRLIHL